MGCVLNDIVIDFTHKGRIIPIVCIISHEICTFLLCFVLYVLANPYDLYTHSLQGCFTDKGSIIGLPRCQWSNLADYGWNRRYQTKMKHKQRANIVKLVWFTVDITVYNILRSFYNPGGQYSWLKIFSRRISHVRGCLTFCGVEVPFSLCCAQYRTILYRVITRATCIFNHSTTYMHVV